MGDNQIEAALQEVMARIEQVCKRVSRSPAEVQLLAASKTRTVNHIQAYIDWMNSRGLRALVGENYVKEFADKQPQLSGAFDAVLIGRLQSNKTQKAAELFDEIESVDSLALIDRLSKCADRIGKRLRVLLQVNISEDKAKGGFSTEDLRQAAEIVIASPMLELRGLMTITAYYEQPEDARRDFARMFALKQSLQDELGVQGLGLSMGMSSDFEVAIEEGATRVRLGEALFGPRDERID